MLRPITESHNNTACGEPVANTVHCLAGASQPSKSGLTASMSCASDKEMGSVSLSESNRDSWTFPGQLPSLEGGTMPTHEISEGSEFETNLEDARSEHFVEEDDDSEDSEISRSCGVPFDSDEEAEGSGAKNDEESEEEDDQEEEESIEHDSEDDYHTDRGTVSDGSEDSTCSS